MTQKIDFRLKKLNSLNVQNISLIKSNYKIHMPFFSFPFDFCHESGALGTQGKHPATVRYPQSMSVLQTHSVLETLMRGCAFKSFSQEAMFITTA